MEVFKVKGIHNIHFSRAVAPITPLMYENGFYIAFNNKLENKLNTEVENKISNIYIENNNEKIIIS